MQKQLSSQIKEWFADKGFVEMLVDNDWIGKPGDNTYTLDDVEIDDSNNLVLKLCNGWFTLIFSGEVNLSTTSKELLLKDCDSLILLFDSSGREKFGPVDVKFFID